MSSIIDPDEEQQPNIEFSTEYMRKHYVRRDDETFKQFASAVKENIPSGMMWELISNGYNSPNERLTETRSYQTHLMIHYGKLVTDPSYSGYIEDLSLAERNMYLSAIDYAIDQYIRNCGVNFDNEYLNIGTLFNNNLINNIISRENISSQYNEVMNIRIGMGMKEDKLTLTNKITAVVTDGITSYSDFKYRLHNKKIPINCMLAVSNIRNYICICRISGTGAGTVTNTNITLYV